MSHTPTPPTPHTANDRDRADQPTPQQVLAEAPRRHGVAALRDAGYAVVKLPEPNDPELCGWLDDTVTTVPGCGKVRVYLDDPRHTSDDAHNLAAAILAAVQIADQDVAR